MAIYTVGTCVNDMIIVIFSIMMNEILIFSMNSLSKTWLASAMDLLAWPHFK